MKNLSPVCKSRAASLARLSALFVVAAATACGGGGGDDPAPAPEPIPAPAPGPAPAPAPEPAPSPAPAPGLPTTVDGGSIQDAHQIGTATFPEGVTATGGTGQDVAGVACGPANLTSTKFTHLSIVRNGEQLAIPGRVGIVRDAAGMLTCVYSIHTHTNDRSGRIHTEGPVPATYTLGQFFAIWGMPLLANNVAGITTDALTAVYVVDNGTVTQFSGDPATIELTSHRHIVLQLGTAITEIPIYTWDGP
jgi:hypothetical protein